METTTPPIPAIAVERSEDRKLSLNAGVSATWVTQGSCPSSCPFMGNGCYTETGKPNLVRRRLNHAHSIGKYSPEKLARFEAYAIDKLTGKRPLRLHILGDSRTRKSTRILATAAKKYKSKHNQPVWTFTHAHNVPRTDWGIVSVLRSCENLEQVIKAHADGFASAMVRNTPHESHKAYDLGNGFKGVPCPQQTGKSESCVTCGLCMNDSKLHQAKRVIVFAPDRGTHKRIANALQVLPVIS